MSIRPINVIKRHPRPIKVGQKMGQTDGEDRQTVNVRRFLFLFFLIFSFLGRALE